MKVIFVGMHNKPGMKPLDSRTMTGKVIDRIIKQIPATCIKTNLCDIDHFPSDIVKVNEMALEWHRINEPEQGDVIVLLGAWVKDHFWYDDLNVISLTHPAGIYGPKNKDEYIMKSVEKIENELIKP